VPRERRAFSDVLRSLALRGNENAFAPLAEVATQNPRIGVARRGYLLFHWSSLKWTTLWSDTPDLATTAFVYLAAGILLHARSGADGWLSSLLLGVVLASRISRRLRKPPIHYRG
jgi:hypothetical protein